MSELSEAYWPATDDFELFDLSCGDTLRASARLTPDHIALIEGCADPTQRRRWTYRELLNDAERTAAALVQRFPAHAHIALWSANCPEWIILQFALALAGMVMVTVNPAYRPSELGYVLRQSRARAIFHQAHYRGVDMGAAVMEALAAEDITLDSRICLDDLDAFIASCAGAIALPTVAPQAAAMIQYTSGTTGQPKGALLNHYSITNNARLMALLKEQDASTINLAVAPMFHTGGCVGAVLGTVQTGGTLVLPDAFDADSMLDLIEQERATYTFAVPTMLIALLEAQARRPRDLSSLVTVFSGGAIVPIEVVQRVEAEFDVRLIIGYGQTETSPAITHTRLHDAPRDKSETIGTPIPQVEVKIIDPQTGATCAVEQPGELCTRGFLLMMGYFEMPEATAATIDSDGWLHTGDLCTMDARGYCRVTGRLKDMIIRGGENIYPREIEELLYTHPAIADVAVLGVPDSYWGEQVAAVVMFKQGSAARGLELAEFLHDKLARHKIPKLWFALDAIPTTASGKLQKFRLHEMHREGGLDDAAI